MSTSIVMFKLQVLWKIASVLVLSLCFSACATVPNISVSNIKKDAAETIEKISVKTNIGRNPSDPLEGFNRAMFRFNDEMDNLLLKPVAEAYQANIPSFVQTAAGNFFGNVGDVWTSANNFLQGNFTDGTSDLTRVFVNTTVGLGGLLDIGSTVGLSKHSEDFGQTLGAWGVRSGPYVVLPFFGPSTVRDVLATPIDIKGNLWTRVRPIRIKNTGSLLNMVDQRAAMLDAGRLIEDAALDRYVFLRDAYLQRRAQQVNPKED